MWRVTIIFLNSRRSEVCSQDLTFEIDNELNLSDIRKKMKTIEPGITINSFWETPTSTKFLPSNLPILKLTVNEKYGDFKVFVIGTGY